MRWAHGDRLPSIKTIMDRYRVLNRMVDLVWYKYA